MWTPEDPIAIARPSFVGRRAISLLQRASLALFALVMVLTCGAAVADLPAQAWEDRKDRGLWALEQAVRDARTDVQVLLVASHPDDRYVMPAAWLRFGHGARVAALLATRGEGGQNAWGPETGAALGRIRTREAEACAARLGIDLYYLNAPDDGFTRTAAEALEQWNGTRTKQDIARIIRQVRPDVVMTTHHPREGHGHDLALLEMLPGAVALAASPSFVTPGALPVQVARLFVGLPQELAASTAGGVILNMDEMEPVRGMTFRRLAYDAMTGEHRSQQPYAPLDELFDPTVPLVSLQVGSTKRSSLPIDGLPSFWDFLPPPNNSAARKQRADWRRLFDVTLGVDNRTAQTSAALGLIQALRGLQDEVSAECRLRIERRLHALQSVVRHSMSIRIEADVAGDNVAVSGEQLQVVLRVLKGLHAERPVRGIEFRGLGDCTLSLYEPPILELGTELSLNEHSLTVRAAIQVPASWGDPGSPVDRLYREPRFVSPIRLACRMEVEQDKHTTVWIETEIALPVEVRPPLELESLPSRIILPADTDAADLRLRIRRHTRQPVVADLRVKTPPGVVVLGQPVQVTMEAFEKEKLVSDLSLRVPSDMDAPVRLLLAELGSQALRIPIHRVDVRVDPDLRVGLVQGRDDATKSVLTSLLGERLRVLTSGDVLEGDLSGFDCIVVDVRAGPSLEGTFYRLLEFAALPGKRLVVFHHKPGEFNREDSGFVGYPYRPFRIGRGRVTQEDAPVRVLAPDHPVLTEPNVLDADDWDGWEQERGIYFPAEFSADYTPLLAMKDLGVEGEPEKGSLLYARVGEGEYIYCALSLYRQLKILHPGAVRLLANLIHPARL